MMLYEFSIRTQAVWGRLDLTSLRPLLLFSSLQLRSSSLEYLLNKTQIVKTLKMTMLNVLKCHLSNHGLRQLKKLSVYSSLKSHLSTSTMLGKVYYTTTHFNKKYFNLVTHIYAYVFYVTCN